MGVRKRIHKVVHALISSDDDYPHSLKVKGNPESDYLEGSQDEDDAKPRPVKVVKKQKPDAVTEFFSLKPRKGSQPGASRQRRVKQPKAPKMSRRVIVSSYGGGRVYSRRKVRGARRIGYL